MKKFSLKKYRRLPRYQQVLVGVLVVVVAFVIWLITSYTPRVAGISLKITVNCENVSEVWCNFSLGEKLLGTVSAGVRENDDRAPFERGEVVSLNIPAEAFDNKTQLRAEKLSFTLVVFDTNGGWHHVKCENAEFFAELGGKYSYTLSCVDGEYICASII